MQIDYLLDERLQLDKNLLQLNKSSGKNIKLPESYFLDLKFLNSEAGKRNWVYYTEAQFCLHKYWQASYQNVHFYELWEGEPQC